MSLVLPIDMGLEDVEVRLLIRHLPVDVPAAVVRSPDELVMLIDPAQPDSLANLWILLIEDGWRVFSPRRRRPPAPA